MGEAALGLYQTLFFQLKRANMSTCSVCYILIHISREREREGRQGEGGRGSERGRKGEGNGGREGKRKREISCAYW